MGHLPVEQLKTVPLVAAATEVLGNNPQGLAGTLKAGNQFTMLVFKLEFYASTE